MKKCCLECGVNIEWNVFNYSNNEFGAPLCMSHQKWIRNLDTTEETKALYFALKERDVPAELEKFDGYKTIDIAVTEAKVNIEVDGVHHNYSNRQALADLKRTYYSFLKGYITLRIPNTLIRSDVEETADFITEILVESRKQKRGY